MLVIFSAKGFITSPTFSKVFAEIYGNSQGTARRAGNMYSLLVDIINDHQLDRKYPLEGSASLGEHIKSSDSRWPQYQRAITPAALYGLSIEREERRIRAFGFGAEGLILVGNARTYPDTASKPVLIVDKNFHLYVKQFKQNNKTHVIPDLTGQSCRKDMRTQDSIT